MKTDGGNPMCEQLGFLLSEIVEGTYPEGMDEKIIVIGGTKMDLTEKVFVEKYRPKKVEDVISPWKNKILKYIEKPNMLPNFMFYNSVPGNGKTTFAKAIIKNLGCDYVYLNGSDERGIDTIRNKIKKFAMTKSFNAGKKCVYFDEADKLTKDAQDALRPITEEYSSNCFFIFTLNYIEKIIDALQSRFVKIHLNNPEKKEIMKHIMKICKAEKIKGDKGGLIKLINSFYPNIRDMVAYLQDLKMDDKPLTKKTVKKQTEFFEEIYQTIKAKKFQSVRDTIIKKGIDVVELNKSIFKFVMADKIKFDDMKYLLEIIAETEYRFSVGANPTIVFIDAVLRMIDVFKGDI